MAALLRYQDAYRAMDIGAVRRIHPSLGREAGQRLQKQFRNCKAFDVAFGQPSPAIGEDPDQATVSARTTYTCIPRTGQPPLSMTSSDIFQLRKLAGDWIIERAGALD